MTKHYQTLYSYDPAQNLVQGYSYGNNAHNRLIPSKQSNRAISQALYNTLAPQQKLHLEQSLFSQYIFDDHGNQLRTATPSLNNLWDAHNSLQSTGFKNAGGYDAEEYSVYAAPGKRSRKVTETKDAQGKLIQVQESLYLGHVEYRSTWKGKDLTYNGAVIREASGKAVAAQLQYKSLRITEGHRQIAQKDIYPSERSIQFYLDSNIDSCQVQLNNSGNLISYRANYPYGKTALSFGNANTQKYQFSGQELEESSLYYYGYRFYLPENFRWLSPDPSGPVNGLNLYIFVGGNPIGRRDEHGLNIDFFSPAAIIIALLVGGIGVMILYHYYPKSNKRFTLTEKYYKRNEVIHFGVNTPRSLYRNDIKQLLKTKLFAEKVFKENLLKGFSSKERAEVKKLIRDEHYSIGYRALVMLKHGGMIGEIPFDIDKNMNKSSPEAHTKAKIIGLAYLISNHEMDVYEEMIDFEKNFSEEMIDYKFRPNITKSSKDILSSKHTHANETPLEMRTGQRFSKAMLVYAAKHNIRIFFHFDHIQKTWSRWLIVAEKTIQV